MADYRSEEFFDQEHQIPYWANDWRVLGKIIDDFKRRLKTQSERIDKQDVTIDMLSKRLKGIYDEKPTQIVPIAGSDLTALRPPRRDWNNPGESWDDSDEF
jgi:hypothetical protein